MRLVACASAAIGLVGCSTKKKEAAGSSSSLSITVWSLDGSPVPGATVVVAGRPAVQADASGKATLTALPAGRTVARVTATGFADSAAVLVLDGATERATAVWLKALGEPIGFDVRRG